VAQLTLSVTVRFTLNVDATLAEVKSFHALLRAKLDTTTGMFTLAGQTFDTCEVKAEAVSAIIEWLGCE